MMIRAILSDKKAGEPELRAQIYRLREQGVDLQVRVTWEPRTILLNQEQGSDNRHSPEDLFQLNKKALQGQAF